MIKTNNFLALVSVLAFIILLRVENTSFANETSQSAFIISILSLFLFGSIYLMNRFSLGANNGGSVEKSGHETKLEIVKSEIFKLQLLSSPSYVAIGFGVYCLFGRNATGLNGLLDSSVVGYGLIVVGVVIEIIILIKLIPLIKERGRLLKGNEVL